MKALLKLLMLLALIVGGKLAKEAAPATMAQVPAPATDAPGRVVLVHQVLTSEPVTPSPEPPRQGSPIITEMF